ncbi:MAG TPA: VIT1/CCC1 transporter family protein [Candidatus Peribacteraceae bacterium]|nr:VIT1/CCC1 transporter family protein [Candidatus Peribacteraceae bacterium]
MDTKTRHTVEGAAKNEISEYFIYRAIASRTKNEHNRKVLEEIAEQEKGHYEQWTKILGKEIAPSRIKIWFYTTLSSLLGLSFSLKLMEKGEGLSQQLYQELSGEYPEALDIFKDEQRHEKELLNMIDEHLLQYMSSFVLGLNDALVELTGALAGLTLALNDTRLIAIVGLITGIAASFSMAASEYLSTEEEGGNAIQASIITGIAYILTVFILVTPFLIVGNVYKALACTLVLAILIIFIFTFYTSVAKGIAFKRRFFKMATISLGVAALSFGVSIVVKKIFGVE